MFLYSVDMLLTKVLSPPNVHLCVILASVYEPLSVNGEQASSDHGGPGWEKDIITCNYYTTLPVIRMYCYMYMHVRHVMYYYTY